MSDASDANMLVDAICDDETLFRFTLQLLARQQGDPRGKQAAQLLARRFVERCLARAFGPESRS